MDSSSRFSSFHSVKLINFIKTQETEASPTIVSMQNFMRRTLKQTVGSD